MNSLSKKLLPVLPLVATLECRGDMTARQLDPVGSSEPAIARVVDPVKLSVQKVLNILGSDLCHLAQKGEIDVHPFSMDIKAVNEALNPDPLDAQSWGTKKKTPPGDVALVTRLFYENKVRNLPFCYSFDGLSQELYKLNLPKEMKKQVDECIKKSNPASAWIPLYEKLEKGLRDEGYRTPLSVCISHYGGDYGPTEVDSAGVRFTITPSCFSTVAASKFGYPPNTQEPYNSYLQHEKNAVLQTTSCVESALRIGDH